MRPLKTINNKIKEQKVMKRVTIMLIIAVLAFSSALFAAGKKAGGPRAFSPMLMGDTISKEALAQLRSNRYNESLSLNKTAGFVVPDTLHTDLTTYDYGWNSPTRTMIKRDGSGGIHIVFANQELLDNSDRKVTYQYNIGRGVPGDENNVDVTSAGDFAYMPTVSTTSEDIAWISVRLRTDLGTPAGTDDFFADIFAGFGLFVGNGGFVPYDAFPQFAMSDATSRAWYISNSIADSLHVPYTDDGGATWVETAGLAWNMSYAGRFAGSGIQTSYDGTQVAVFETFFDAEFAAGDTVPNVHQYSISEDDGATWTKVPVYWSGWQTDVDVI